MGAILHRYATAC